MISATHLHAMLVHFPIALLIVGFLCEMVSLFYKTAFFRQGALFLLILGTLGSIASFFAGKAAGDGMDEGSLGIAMEQHKQAAILSLWLTIVTAVLYLAVYFLQNKKVWVKVLSVLMFALVIGAIGRTGYLGGQLVFKHGAGIELGFSE
jgi:uncharacterized membrane protein